MVNVLVQSPLRPYFYFFCLSRRCPLLATFLSVLFCLLSLLISERFSGLVWFGSVYLVTTAGFVADQLMSDKQHCILYIIYSCLFKFHHFLYVMTPFIGIITIDFNILESYYCSPVLIPYSTFGYHASRLKRAPCLIF